MADPGRPAVEGCDGKSLSLTVEQPASAMQKAAAGKNWRWRKPDIMRPHDNPSGKGFGFGDNKAERAGCNQTGCHAPRRKARNSLFSALAQQAAPH